MSEHVFRDAPGFCETIGEFSAGVNDDHYGTLHEEIVRCRDCKRYIPQGTYRFNDGVVNKDSCDVIRGFVVQINPNGFCAWGERKDV